MTATGSDSEAPCQTEAKRVVPIRTDSQVPSIPPLNSKASQGGIAGNLILTAKYTFITFLPKNLFEQFSRAANQYFALIAILQMVPGLSPTSPITTLFPLGCVLLINMIKEIYDDYYRHQEDGEVNFRKVEVLRADDTNVLTNWKDLRVGDVVKLERDMEIPADVVFLGGADPEGLCYLETANLDGETNLKLRYHFQAGDRQLSDAAAVHQFAKEAVIECELPNHRLYEFEGAVVPKGSGGRQREGLDASALLLRGCTLRKTEWIVGVVVYAGTDSKVQQNMFVPKRKVTQLELLMNRFVLTIFGILIGLALVCAATDQAFASNQFAGVYYLQFDGQWPDPLPGVAGFGVAVIRFIILFNQLIPISLYVALEMAKFVQCMLMDSDLLMYHAPTDTRFSCRTTTLNEDLGQVQYVLSDKTGTLTENIMSFVWCSIGGQLFGRDKTPPPNSAAQDGSEPKHQIINDLQLLNCIHAPRKGVSQANPQLQFVLALAICNSVNPHYDGQEGAGKLSYQAESPDEEALVEGAAEMGVALVRRTARNCTVEVKGQPVEVEVGALFEFTSDRKRMSIVGRLPDGSCRVWCKGADNIILERLSPHQHSLRPTQTHLAEMSHAGLRTLCIASRELTEAQYQEIVEAFLSASSSLDDRDGAVAKVAESVERDLTLLGATAVEDRLQAGVPDTIAALLSAGMRVWVLTGDKLETAISIAATCKLLRSTMHVVVLKASDVPSDAAEATKVLQNKLNTVNTVTSAGGAVGLVIDGTALTAALQPEAEAHFLALAMKCSSAVCCRVSPRQKAEVTDLVIRHAKAIVLGIGDGANDVGMIQAAHIGCGISGREGRAAVMASDFSFAQFSYLRRLLLVHGHWNFTRNEQVIFYAFYKNVAYVLTNFYYAIASGFSAQPLYSAFMIGTFNLFWASLPTVIHAVTEQVLPADTLYTNPKIYSQVAGRTQSQLRAVFWLWMLSGVWHSVAVFYIPMFALFGEGSATGLMGSPSDLATLGIAVYTAVVITVNLKIAFYTRFFTWMMHVSLWPISIGLWLLLIYIVSLLYTSWFGLFPELSGVPGNAFKQASFWLAVFLAPAIAMLPDFTAKTVQRNLFPRPMDIFEEIEKLKSKGKQPEEPLEGAVNAAVTELQMVSSGGSSAEGHSLPKLDQLLAKCASFSMDD